MNIYYECVSLQKCKLLYTSYVSDLAFEPFVYVLCITFSCLQKPCQNIRELVSYHEVLWHYDFCKTP